MLGNDLQKIFKDCDFIALNSKELDITKRDDVFARFMTIQPEIVINAAAYTDVDGAEKAADIADVINGYAVGVLAKASREINAVFVHFSTDYVFDGETRHGHREDDKTSPINAYGRSKELGEKLVLEEMELQAWPNQAAGKYFIIRTSWLFGGHGDNFVNKMIKMIQEDLKKDLEELEKDTKARGKKNRTEKVLLESEPQKLIEVVDDQFGKPTYTLDLARQVRWLLESKEYPSGIYHIVNENITNRYDFAKTILNLAKLPIFILPCSSKDYVTAAKRPKYAALMNTKLPPLRSWQEALEDYIKTLSAC